MSFKITVEYGSVPRGVECFPQTYENLDEEAAQRRMDLYLGHMLDISGSRVEKITITKTYD
jgi:hypothetical protein